MTRIVYISGRYRHWKPDGTMDFSAMKQEVAAEQDWCNIIAAAGHMWLAPLSNSEFLQGVIPDTEFIERDIAMIRRLQPGHDCILMRPCWDEEPESKGARAELEAATDHGLLVLNGTLGAAAVVDALRQLDAGE